MTEQELRNCIELIKNSTEDAFLTFPEEYQRNVDVFEAWRRKRGAEYCFLNGPDFVREESEYIRIILNRLTGIMWLELPESIKSNRKIVLEFACMGRDNLRYVDESLKKDKEFVIETVLENPLAFRHAHTSVRNDKEVALLAVRAYPNNINYTYKRIIPGKWRARDDEDIIFAMADTDASSILPLVSTMFLRKPQNQERIFHMSDRERFREIVSKNGWALEYLNEAYWVNDDELLSSVIKNCPRAFGIICHSSISKKRKMKFIDDEKLASMLVETNGQYLRFFSDRIKKDKKIVMAALKNDGSALEYVDEELKKDRDIIVCAVKNHGGALHYAPKEFKDDEKIALLVLKTDGQYLQFFSERIKKDKKIVMLALKEDGLALEYVDKELKNDREIVLRAVKTYGGALSYAPEEFKNDKEIVLLALKTDGQVLDEVSETLKDDEDVVKAAIKEYPPAIEFASDRLKEKFRRK